MVEVLDENGDIVDEIKVQGGYPAMEFTDHLMYDTLSNRLLSYSLSQKCVSFFSFDTKRWSLAERHIEEPNYYNHARTFILPIHHSIFLEGMVFTDIRMICFVWILLRVNWRRLTMNLY